MDPTVIVNNVLYTVEILNTFEHLWSNLQAKVR